MFKACLVPSAHAHKDDHFSRKNGAFKTSQKCRSSQLQLDDKQVSIIELAM